MGLSGELFYAEELELIERLKKVQQIQRDAFEELESALAGGGGDMGGTARSGRSTGRRRNTSRSRGSTRSLKSTGSRRGKKAAAVA